MNNSSNHVLALDDLIEAAFDQASLVTSNPKVAAELASRTVARWLARTGRLDLVRLLSSSTTRPKVRSVSGALHAQAA